MARIAQYDMSPILNAALLWRDKCLLNNGSLFSKYAVWTLDNIKEFERRFVQQYLADDRKFYDKLQDQLAGAKKETIYLAAEMLWVMYLFPMRLMSATTKRADIRRVLGWSGEQISEDHELLQTPLENGIGNPGTAYNTHRYREVTYIINLSSQWLQLDTAIKKQYVENPWAFGVWIDGLSDSQSRLLRHIVVFLLFPDYYERIASRKHKKKIIDSFSQECAAYQSDNRIPAGSLTSDDHKLYFIRQQLQSKYPGQNLDFYLPPLRDKWFDSDIEKEQEEGSLDNKPNIKYWIEKTIVSGRTDRLDGDHALGKALWSPQESANGRDIYSAMREVGEGDIVFHLTDNKGISGVSIAGKLDDTFVGLPGSDWAGRPGYRISLSNFQTIEPILDRSWFLENELYAERLRSLLDEGHRLFYSRNLELNQGAYLTEVPVALLEILNDAYRERTKRDLPLLVPSHQLSGVNENGKDLATLITELSTAMKRARIAVSDQILRRIIAGLITKPFLILTGLSGSGKTKIAHAVAAWLSKSNARSQSTPQTLLIVPVGSDWTTREPLFGYPDALVPGDYRLPASGVLQFIMRAISDPLHPYFLILDEMNLSHVERYLADVLSAMESDVAIQLHEQRNYSGGNWNGVPHEIQLPANLFVIGTVNIDETTYMFSPKVLDRANVIEFSVKRENLSSFLENPEPVVIKNISGAGASFAESFVARSKDKSISLAALGNSGDSPIISLVKKALEDIFDVLAEAGAEFGYRPAYEISRFVYCYAKVSNADWKLDDAIDAAIMQKLLPKLHGSKTKLAPVVEKLKTICAGKYPISSEKLARMEQRLKQNGFTSYAEA